MRLFIANIPFSITESDLSSLFKHFGKISNLVILKDAKTGKRKGYGFVDIKDEQMAQQAIKSLNGQMIGDRAINIKPAEKPNGRFR